MKLVSKNTLGGSFILPLYIIYTIHTYTNNICIHNKNSIGIVALCNSGNWLHSVARMDIIHRCVYYYRCIIHVHKRCRPPNTRIYIHGALTLTR